MPLCQLLLLSGPAKICAGLLLVFCSRGAFPSCPVPAVVVQGGVMWAAVPLPVAGVSLGSAHLKPGSRPGWLWPAPCARVAPGAGPSPPRDVALVCGGWDRAVPCSVSSARLQRLLSWRERVVLSNSSVSELRRRLERKSRCFLGVCVVAWSVCCCVGSDWALFYKKIKQYNLTQIIFIREKCEQERKKKKSVLHTCTSNSTSQDRNVPPGINNQQVSMGVHTFLLQPCLPTRQGSSVQPWFSARWRLAECRCGLLSPASPLSLLAGKRQHLRN